MTAIAVQTQFKSPKSLSSRASPVALANRGIFVAAVAMTRPANATQYGANDNIGRADSGTPANAGDAIMEFTDIGPKGGAVEIVSAALLVAINAVTLNMGAFTLHLFNAAPAAKLDNALFNVEAADRAKYLGGVTIGTPVDVGDTIYVENHDHKGKVVKLADGATSLWGVLVGAGTDVPVSGAVYETRLTTRAAA